MSTFIWVVVWTVVGYLLGYFFMPDHILFITVMAFFLSIALRYTFFGGDEYDGTRH